jgi:hypothetical protein
LTVGVGGPRIAVWIDPAPLGLRNDQLRALPATGAEMQGLLPRIETPVERLDGSVSAVGAEGRADLAQLERLREQVDADYERRADAWPRLERQFRDVAARLDQAGDRASGQAWLGVARSVRFQKGRRSDTLSAYTEAVRWDPQLVELAGDP